MGKQGQELYTWIMKYKAKTIEKYMLCPVREQAGMEAPPPAFVTNRVESIYNLLNLESGKNKDIVIFVSNARNLVKRQSENVKYAILYKGPHKLHPSISHPEMSANVWCMMSEDDRTNYINMVLNTSILDTIPSAKQALE